MKKIMLFIVLAFSTSIFASIKIVNNTTSGVKVDITYSSPGFCNDDTKLVGPNSSETIKTGACCPNRFSIKGTSGPLMYKYKSISTNLCRHIFTITQEDNAFKIDDDKW